METTYTTNLALWRMWTDPHNIKPDSSHYVQPLLHIHDALLSQFPAELVAPAGRKHAEWFNNPVRIGNVTLRIPYSAGYGPSWGECDTPFPS